MDNVFLSILNMSLTGAFIIAVIYLVRFPLKKAPKIISYCLWAVAGFRLVFPFTIESAWSLIPFRAAPIQANNVVQPTLPVGGLVEGSLPAMEVVVGSTLQEVPNNYLVPTVMPSIGMTETGSFLADVSLLTIGSVIWVAGVVLMLAYAVISYVFLARKMRGATLLQGNIYEADTVQTPFVLGIFSPKIYLPVNLSENARHYVILHERAHIQRRDHIVKILAYLILCLHWFNPLAWLAFALMNVDMEMSCDETVLKKMGTKIKKDYSHTLVTLATDWRMSAPTPLAFSEGRIKGRIKHIMKFKKSHKLVSLVAIALVVALSLGFAFSRAEEDIYEEPEYDADSIDAVDEEAEPDTIDEMASDDYLYVYYYVEDEYEQAIIEGLEDTRSIRIFNFHDYPIPTETICPIEATTIGTEYIWTMFGEDITGASLIMEYSAPEWCVRTYWRGTVLSAEDDDRIPKPFMFRIDAVTGEWIEAQNVEAFNYIMGEPVLSGEIRNGLHSTSEILTVLPNEEAQYFSEIAWEFIARHSPDSRVVELSVHEVALRLRNVTNVDREPIIASPIIEVEALDDTGTSIMIVQFCPQTLQLFRIWYICEIVRDLV